MKNRISRKISRKIEFQETFQEKLNSSHSLRVKRGKTYIKLQLGHYAF